MSEIRLMRTSSGALVPMDDEEAAKIKRIKAGSVVTATLVQMRNGKFFRKWWALAKFAFDIWADTVPAEEYKGVEVKPEFERFRKDLTIMAGYYRPVFDARNQMHLEAESISWASMDEDKFERFYSQTINVILGKVLMGRGLTDAAIRAHVDRVMEFDS